jgi:hypothetical protein
MDKCSRHAGTTFHQRFDRRPPAGHDLTIGFHQGVPAGSRQSPILAVQEEFYGSEWVPCVMAQGLCDVAGAGQAYEADGEVA